MHPYILLNDASFALKKVSLTCIMLPYVLLLFTIKDENILCFTAENFMLELVLL